MKAFGLDFLRRSIGAKIIFWFLTINIVSCGLLAWRTYDISRESLEEAIQTSLQVVAKKKVEQLENLTLDKFRSVQALMYNPAVAAAARDLSQALRTDGKASQAYREAVDRHAPTLDRLADAFNFVDCALVSPDGETLFSQSGASLFNGNLLTGPLKDTQIADTIDRARTLLQAEISAFQIYPGRSAPAAFVAGPILDHGVVIAVIVFALDNQELFSVVNDYTGLGETGEVLVAARLDKNQMVVVNPLRNDASRPFSIRTTLEHGAFPALARALGGCTRLGAFRRS